MGMEKKSAFTPELLKMMLTEERQKFVSALGDGASWKVLENIRKNINKIYDVLDSVDRNNDHQNRHSSDPASR